MKNSSTILPLSTGAVGGDFRGRHKGRYALEAHQARHTQSQTVAYNSLELSDIVDTPTDEGRPEGRGADDCVGERFATVRMYRFPRHRDLPISHEQG